jgi:hypothetical protein
MSVRKIPQRTLWAAISLTTRLLFQISQMLKVLNGYDRYKKRREGIQEDLADAEDQIARQQAHIAAPAVALISDHPDFITENELHKYLALIGWSSTR